MTLEQLKIKYKDEQKKIAKDRKEKKFKDKDEDITVQKASWENYLVDRLNITGEGKHKKELFDYFLETLYSGFVSIRNSYYKQEISLEEYINGRNEIAINLEQKYFDLGLITNRMTQEEHNSFWDRMREMEVEYKPDLTEITTAELKHLCSLQMPVGIEYSEDLKNRNEIPL